MGSVQQRFCGHVPTPLSPSWQVEQTPGAFKALDANGQALAYVYARETLDEARHAKALTLNEARRIAILTLDRRD